MITRLRRWATRVEDLSRVENSLRIDGAMMIGVFLLTILLLSVFVG